MDSNYFSVTITMSGKEFKDFKYLIDKLCFIVSIPSSRFDEFYDSLNEVDIDVHSSLTHLKVLIDNNNYCGDSKITKFLYQLKDL